MTSAVWFPLHSKGCEADYVCTPAPIHNPDGSESLWCYTRPMELYGELRDRLGHFPLQHFWGPAANIRSSQWIADSAVIAAGRWKPDFFYIYLPHLDYAAQRTGPDSPEAAAAVADLDQLLGGLAAGMGQAYDEEPFWLVAGEYAITPVDNVCFPNRVLRRAGLLTIRDEADGERLDCAASRAWAMVDHQFSHVFLRDGDGDADATARVVEAFRHEPGIAEVLVGAQRGRYGLEHPRSGEIVLISEPRSWQAYPWWLSDDRARRWPARSISTASRAMTRWSFIMTKPRRGYRWTRDELRVRTGPRRSMRRSGRCCCFPSPPICRVRRSADTDIFGVVLRHFGLKTG